MHDNVHSPVWAFLYFLFNLRGEPGISLTALAALSVQPCLTNFMNSAGSWMHPKAVSKSWGGLLVKSEKRGIGSCVNESVMMLLLLILDTQLPSSPSSSSLCQSWHSGSAASYLANCPLVLPWPHVLIFRKKPCSQQSLAERKGGLRRLM